MKRAILAVVVLSGLADVQQTWASQAAPIPERIEKGHQSVSSEISAKTLRDEAINRQLDVVISNKIENVSSAPNTEEVLAEIKKLSALYDERAKAIAAGKKTGTSSFENRFYVVQGLEFSTSEENDEKLFEDENYYLQLFYDWEVPGQGFETNLSCSFSIDFRQSYTETTNAPSADDYIRKADQLGMSISPKLSCPEWPFFIRIDIRGIMVQSDEDDVDEEFKWEPGLVLGLEKLKDNHFFRGELGYVYYERLPEDSDRMMARLSYGYQLEHYAVITSLEYSGFDKNEDQEARAQLGLQLNPDKFFGSIGKFLEGVFKLKDDKS